MSAASMKSVLVGVILLCIATGCDTEEAGSETKVVSRYEEPLAGDALAHFEAGQELKEAEEWALAEAQLVQAVDLAPFSLEAHTALLDLLRRRWSEMLAGTGDHGTDSVHAARYRLMQSLDDWYAQRIEADPANPVLPYMQSQVWWIYNNAARSIAAARRAVELDSSFTSAWVQLATVSEYMADYAGASEYYLRAVRLSPGDIEMLRRLVLASRYDSWSVFETHATTLVESLLARGTSEDSTAAIMQLMQIASRAPDIERRIDYYRKALETDPNRGSTHNALYSVLQGHDPEAATTILASAIDKGLGTGASGASNWATTYYHKQALLNLGRALRKGGEAGEALGYLEKALEVGGRSTQRVGRRLQQQIQVEIGLALAALGDTVSAVTNILEVLAVRADTLAFREYALLESARGATESEILEGIWRRRLEGAYPAPEFRLQDTNGDTISNSDYAGRVVFLTFWFPSCGPCRNEFPYLAAVARKLYDRGLRVVAINGVTEQNADVKPILENYGSNIVGLLTPHRRWARERYQVTRYPTNFLISPDGMIISNPVLQNAEDQAELERWLNGYFDYLHLAGERADQAAVYLAPVGFGSQPPDD